MFQGGEGLNAQETLPNRLIKQQQEVGSYVYKKYHICMTKIGFF